MRCGSRQDQGRGWEVRSSVLWDHDGLPYRSADVSVIDW